MTDTPVMMKDGMARPTGGDIRGWLMRGEVGMAVGLGKPVWAYFDPVDSLRALVAHDAQGGDAKGFLVEDFGLPRNLMLACTWAGASETAEEAAAGLAQYLVGHKQP